MKHDRKAIEDGVVEGGEHDVVVRARLGGQEREPAMAFKLIEAAQSRWRAVNGSHLVALVRAGAKFEKGVLVERQEVAA